jgi:hypothetical protein
MVKSAKQRVAEKKAPIWELRLYVAGATARSGLVNENLQSLCQQRGRSLE